MKRKGSADVTGELRILYVEDDPDTLEVISEYIRRKWSSSSEAVRSLERATRLVREEGFRPDLVIHDCSPLYRDSDEMDSYPAGDALYVLCLEEQFPVVVVSGSIQAEMEEKLPYRGNPPIAWQSKPLTWQSSADGGEGRWVEIDEVVASYLSWVERRS